MLAARLFGSLISVRQSNHSDEDELNRFETSVLYKQCFSKASGVDLFGTSTLCKASLIAIWNEEVVGVLQILDSNLTQFEQFCSGNSNIIVNFCISEQFRSHGLGRRMLNIAIQLMNMYPLYIAINKEEPLNDTSSLQRLYKKYGFSVKTFESSSYILLRLQIT